VFSTAASVAWSSNGNPAGTLYRAEISSTGLFFTEFASGTALSATADGLTEKTTYFFRVRAENANQLPTDYTLQVATRTPGFVLQIPGTPFVLSRTSSTLVWSWADRS